MMWKRREQHFNCFAVKFSLGALIKFLLDSGAGTRDQPLKNVCVGGYTTREVFGDPFW